MLRLDKHQQLSPIRELALVRPTWRTPTQVIPQVVGITVEHGLIVSSKNQRFVGRARGAKEQFFFE